MSSAQHELSRCLQILKSIFLHSPSVVEFQPNEGSTVLVDRS